MSKSACILTSFAKASACQERLMMSVDWFAHVQIRGRKLAIFFALVHSNGFNSPSMVGINSVTVG